MEIDSRKIQLKWSLGYSSINTLEKIISSENNIEQMYFWMKNIYNYEITPPKFRNLILHYNFIGLRESEAIERLRLIEDKDLT